MGTHTQEVKAGDSGSFGNPCLESWSCPVVHGIYLVKVCGVERSKREILVQLQPAEARRNGVCYVKALLTQENMADLQSLHLYPLMSY